MKHLGQLLCLLIISCSSPDPTSVSSHAGEENLPEQAKSFFFEQSIASSGKLVSLQYLPDNFWSQRGIPVGGARLVNGWLVWIQVIQDHRELRAWNGDQEITLLSDKDWHLPMLRLGFFYKEDKTLLNLYCCAAFGGGCDIGAVFELDFAAGRASARPLSLSAEDKNRDFPLGITITYEDERWFAFQDGLFWARVPARGRLPMVITSDGFSIQERFQALIAGDQDAFPIKDHLMWTDRGLLYINSVMIQDAQTGKIHESLWHVILQNNSNGTILEELLGSWPEALEVFQTLGLSNEDIAGFRRTNLETSWVPILGLYEGELVEILERDASYSLIEKAEARLKILNKQVRPIIPSRSTLSRVDN